MGMVIVYILGFLTGTAALAGFLAYYGAIREEEKQKHRRTNAERIREMSDLDLAKVIICPYGASSENCVDYDDGCNACCLEWLKEEADAGKD